jgi:hypothetical protein
MRVNIDAFDVGAFLYFFLAVTGAIFLITAYAGAQDEILPQNAPEVQTKAIHIMTAEERSTILISDIWKPPELERVKIGQGGRLGAAKSDTPVGPYGWQAFVSQDAIGSWRGGAEAMAYGGL